MGWGEQQPGISDYLKMKMSSHLLQPDSNRKYYALWMEGSYFGINFLNFPPYSMAKQTFWANTNAQRKGVDSILIRELLSSLMEKALCGMAMYII